MELTSIELVYVISWRPALRVQDTVPAPRLMLAPDGAETLLTYTPVVGSSCTVITVPAV